MGTSSVTGQETFLFADNISFDGTARGGGLSTNGQLFIGSTTLPHIRVGNLASADNSVTITNGAGTINLAVPAGGGLSLGAFGSTPNANGLTLSSGVLNMQPADGTNPGGVSTTTQNWAGAKIFNTSAASASIQSISGGGGVATIQYPSSATSFNFNMPVSAGTTGYFLTSGGGGSTNMTWTDPATVSGVLTLTGTSGGAISPTAGNITFSGGSTGLTLVGSGSTLTYGGDLVVANGGTGNTTFTAYSVICAGTTSTGAFQNVSGVGTSGQVLTSNGAAALPTWQSNGNGNVSGPGSSTDRAISTWNGTGGNALFNNSTTNIDSTGMMTNSAQPAFTAYVNSSISNVTGDGTAYTVIFNAELQDVGGNFNTTTGVFTAPKTGTYIFTTNITVFGLSALDTQGFIGINTTGGAYYSGIVNPGATRELVTANEYTFSNSVVVPMTATNTASVFVIISGSTKTVSILGTTNYATVFTGALLF